MNNNFFGLFLAMGCNSMFFDGWSPDFDIIGSLPLEVAIIILRKLDGKSLLTAAQVSTKWLRIIKFDRVLRQTVRDELAKQRQEKLKRQLFLSDACDYAAHSAAFYPVKKARRTFEKSLTTMDRQKKKKNWGSSTATLRKLR